MQVCVVKQKWGGASCVSSVVHVSLSHAPVPSASHEGVPEIDIGLGDSGVKCVV